MTQPKNIKDYSKYKYAVVSEYNSSLSVELSKTKPNSRWATIIQDVKVTFPKETGVIITGYEQIFRDVRDDVFVRGNEEEWLDKSAYEERMFKKYYFFGKESPKLVFLNRGWRQLSNKTPAYYKHSKNFIITIEDEDKK